MSEYGWIRRGKGRYWHRIDQLGRQFCGKGIRQIVTKSERTMPAGAMGWECQSCSRAVQKELAKQASA